MIEFQVLNTIPDYPFSCPVSDIIAAVDFDVDAPLNYLERARLIQRIGINYQKTGKGAELCGSKLLLQAYLFNIAEKVIEMAQKDLEHILDGIELREGDQYRVSFDCGVTDDCGQLMVTDGEQNWTISAYMEMRNNE